MYSPLELVPLSLWVATSWLYRRGRGNCENLQASISDWPLKAVHFISVSSVEILNPKFNPKGQCLVNAVVSMGRRNTQLETHPALKTKAKNARWVRSAGTLSLARFSPSAVKQIGSPWKALSNQRVGWCCIDRLNWHDLPGPSAKHELYKPP
jgi:hypothetical protein